MPSQGFAVGWISTVEKILTRLALVVEMTLQITSARLIELLLHASKDFLYSMEV
jgi:hypothetical protein